MSAELVVKPRTRLLAALPWAIALLPLILLGLTWVAGLWPQPVVVALQVVALYALVIWDTRLLVRVAVHLSWLTALRTPVPYLLERARRTGAARVSPWVMLLSTVIWISALIPSVLEAIDHESRHGDLRLASVWNVVTTENHDYLDAASKLGTAKPNESVAEVSRRAADFREALSTVETVVDVSYFPPDQQPFVDEIVYQSNRLATLLETSESATTRKDLDAVRCRQTLAIRDLNDALFQYLQISENPQADRLSDDIRISHSMAEFCQLTLQVDTARQQLVAQMGLDSLSTPPDDLQAFAKSIDLALPRLQQHAWPAELDPTAMSAIAGTYEALASTARRWGRAVEAGDSAVADSESRAFHRELDRLDDELATQTAEYYQAILGATSAE